MTIPISLSLTASCLPMRSRRPQGGWLATLLLLLLPTFAQAQAPCAPTYTPAVGIGTGGAYAFVTQQSFTATCTGKLTTFVMKPGIYSDDLRGMGYYVVPSIKDATGTTTLATLPRTD